MYAIIKIGGKQYKVSAGDILRVEKLAEKEGEAIEIKDVLMLVDSDRVEVGTPFVEGATVEATLTAQGRGPKIKIIKFRRRKHYRKQMGHRQAFTELKITGIKAGGLST